MTTDEKYMKQAIKQAKKAYAIDEVPIGCIIVRDEDGKVIARGYNRRNTDKNTLSHAELNAIRKASKKLGDWRLEGCTMNLLQIAGFNHQVKIVQGVCQEECSVMLSDFFKELREKKKRKKHAPEQGGEK